MKESTHYLGDKQEFDVSNADPSSGMSSPTNSTTVIPDQRLSLETWNSCLSHIFKHSYILFAADLRQMHQYNKEGTIISPRDRGKNVEPSLVKENLNSSIERKPAGEKILLK